jgi:hypothetical protein
MMKEKIGSLDLALCRVCGGRCCTGSPGIWVDPERFFDLFFGGDHLTLDQLREQLPALGLRLWTIRGVPIPAPGSRSSGCASFGGEGCEFTVTERPCQCLGLIPNKETLNLDKGCLCKMPVGFSREDGRLRWEIYWQTINLEEHERVTIDQ